MKIDVVIIWVDANDVEWRKEKAKWKNENILDSKVDDSEKRYRDWENLKYVFRGIDKFMPWVNKVHLVTCGHIPEWLNLECSKLNFVKHSDYMPQKYLPTFNSNAIELNLHRINELEEHFIYFNDDMFTIKKVEEKDFFVNGMPCESAILNIITPSFDNVVSKIWFNDWAVINRNFDKTTSIKENISKWINVKYGKEVLRTLMLMQWKNFSGFKFTHIPTSMLKSTLNEVWTKEYDVLDKTSLNKFRSPENNSQYLIKDWQLAKGTFYPRNVNFGKVFNVNNENINSVCESIVKQKYKMICVNDTDDIDDFEKTKNMINSAFDKIFPEKSCFER